MDPATPADDSASPGDRDVVGADVVTGDSDGDAGAPPRLDPIGPLTVAEGATLAFSLSATSYATGALTYACTLNCPSGLAVTAGTGAVSFAPGYDQAGTYAGVTFAATDDGGTATAAATITVTNVPHFQGWVGRKLDGSITSGWTFGDSGRSGVADGAFTTPRGVAAGGGFFYVTDSGHRVQRFDRAGVFAGWIGVRQSDSQPTSGWTFGDASRSSAVPGGLNTPEGIAVRPDGSLAVFDNGNRRLSIFTPDGTYLTSVGHAGVDDAGLGREGGFCASAADGTLYVSDRILGRVDRWSAANAFAGWIGALYDPTLVSDWSLSGDLSTYGSADGMMTGPSGIARLSGGDLLIAEYNGYRVQRFSPSGTALGWFGVRESSHTFSGGFITGDVAESAGGIDGGFSGAMGIAVDSSDRIYVVESQTALVEVFNSDGTFASKFGSRGTGDGQFERPTDIQVAADGTIYVADVYRVSKFSSAGVFQGWIGMRNTASSPTPGWSTGDTAVGGSANGAFSSVTGLALDEGNDRLLVADLANNRVQVFALSTGAYVSKTAVTNPNYVTRDTGGNFYVTTAYFGTIVVLDSAYAVTATYGYPGEGAGAFVMANGITASGTTLYVTDYNWLRGANRLQRWGTDGTFQGWIGKKAPVTAAAGWHLGDRSECGRGVGMFTRVAGVVVDEARGLLVVADYAQDLSLFDLALGTFERSLPLPDIYGDPRGVAIDGDGQLLVATRSGVDVVDLDTGAHLTSFGSTGLGDGQLTTGVWGIAVDGYDIYLVDSAGSRVQKW